MEMSASDDSKVIVTVSCVAVHSTVEHVQIYCTLHAMQDQHIQFLANSSCIKYRKSHQKSLTSGKSVEKKILHIADRNLRKTFHPA